MFAELYLSNGVTKIDLLGGNRNGTGISLDKMMLSRAQREPKGAFRQAFGAVDESYEITITDYSHDGIAARQQELDRLLEQAYNYFTTDVEDLVVWLCAKTADETNARYALVFAGMINTYNDVYAQPFVGKLKKYSLANITLVLERSSWQANIPDYPECIAITNAYEFDPEERTWASSRTLTDVQSLFLTASGSILAGAQNIERTANDGGAWAVVKTGNSAGRFWQFIQPSTRIWVVYGTTAGSAIATSGLYYSDDDGVTWTQHTSTVDLYSIVFRSHDNALILGGNGTVHYILGVGAITTLSTSPVGLIKAMAYTLAGTVVLGDEYSTWRIVRGTYTAEQTYSESQGAFLQILVVDDYLLLTNATSISISRDDGITWDIFWREWGTNVLYQLANGDIVASQNASALTHISRDGGLSWQAWVNTFASNPIRAFVEKPDTYMFAGYVNTISRSATVNTALTYGAYEPTCDDMVYLANHRLESNWTHLLIYDSSGTSFTTVLPSEIQASLVAGTDRFMFPSPVGVGDIFYVGITSTITDTGAFSNIFFELTDRNYTLTIVTEYWNGSAWIAFTTGDMYDGTDSLKRSGLISWRLDSVVVSSMAATTINSINAYWVRFRVTALGTLTTLIPKLFNIYIVQQPFIEFDNLAGDVMALAQIKLYNRTDKGDFPLASQSTRRLIMGLRSVERGERFTAYINFAQKQNPLGITIGVLGGSAFVVDTGLAAASQYISDTRTTSLDTWVNIAQITLDSSLAHDFAGTYQFYIRHSYEIAGGAFTKVRLRFVNYDYQSEVIGNETTLSGESFGFGFAELAYVGQFTISSNRYLKSSDASNELNIFVEINAADTGHTVNLFELIMIPADEWIGDFDFLRSGITNHVDIDSATFPKRTIRSLQRKNGSNLIDSVASSSVSGAFGLQPGQRQKLWVLAQNFTPSFDYFTDSLHTLVHQIKLWHHARWVGLRGND